MNFSYRNNLWKGNATNVMIPTNARPYSNDDPNLKTIPRTPFKANPIKHWRKQLQPKYSTKSSKQVSLDQYYAPNSAIHVGTNNDCATSNIHLLKENIHLLNECNGTKITDTNPIKCVGGTHNVRRQASTNIQKNYYRHYSKYLQSKCKTHAQNSTLGQQNSDGTYQSTMCNTDYMKCNKPIISNMSNSAHFTQGSVSASSNTLRKRYNAVTKNSASLKNAYGLTYVHSLTYPNNSAYQIRYVKGDNTSTNLCNQQFKICSTSS